jgi:hypothetical protein
VDCRPETQVQRAVAARRDDHGEARARIAAQTSRGKRRAAADYVIETEGTLAQNRRAGACRVGRAAGGTLAGRILRGVGIGLAIASSSRLRARSMSSASTIRSTRLAEREPGPSAPMSSAEIAASIPSASQETARDLRFRPVGESSEDRGVLHAGTRTPAPS